MPNEVDQQTALDALGWEPLKEQRKKAKAKIMFKILKTWGPSVSMTSLLSKKKF